jgi:hypothetical protein
VTLLIRSLGVLTSAAVASLVASVSAQTGVSAAKPQVRTAVNRTAIWVGDRFRFTIDIDCPRDVDVLDEDLSKDKLKLEGLDIVSSDSSRIEGPGETTTRRFTYELTTYRVNVAVPRIAPLSVRYYVRRPGRRLDDSAPAGEVLLPGASIAFRSTLPEAQANNVRDSKPAMSRPRVFALAQPVGLALVILSFVPAVVWAIGAVERRRHRPVYRSVRKVHSDERASLQAVRELDLSSEEARREAYTRIDVLIREHLRDVCGVPGDSLTPAEAHSALAQRDSRIDAERVAALLAACERARYAPGHVLPSADACRDSIAEAEQLLGAG